MILPTGNYVCEDGSPDFEDAIHEDDRSIVGYVVRVFVTWFIE